MINTMTGIDHVASAGTSVWHRASAIAKLLLATALIGLAVASPSLALSGVLIATAAALALTARLPLRLVAAAAGYPLVFSILFLITRWDGSWTTPLRLLLRPLTASLTAVWLVGTTPYPDLFAPLSRALPRSVGDGLFLTYRSLFDLTARASRLWRSMRLRGGSVSLAPRRLPLAGEGLATLVLHGFDRSQQLYSTMLLRGHSGRICGCRHWSEWVPSDRWVGAVGVLLGAAAVRLWSVR